jgi:hypothetical protein
MHQSSRGHQGSERTANPADPAAVNRREAAAVTPTSASATQSADHGGDAAAPGVLHAGVYCFGAGTDQVKWDHLRREACRRQHVR